MINLYGLPLHKLEELMLAEGQKKYRATQLYIWLYEKKATTFDEMSDISLKFREVLKEKYCLEKPKKEEAPSNMAILGRYILTPEIFEDHYLITLEPEEKEE